MALAWYSTKEGTYHTCLSCVKADSILSENLDTRQESEAVLLRTHCDECASHEHNLRDTPCNPAASAKQIQEKYSRK